MNIEETGLVLEGGGMRGVFTAGVLDYFIDNELYFPYTVAVSAGACNGLSYASRQRGRAKASNIDLLKKYKYIGFNHLIRKRSIMDFDLLFDAFPNNILPYDFEAYKSNPGRFVMVLSNCYTGNANYYEEKDSHEQLLAICRASCSLPYVCPVAYVDDIPFLDGGVTDAIPVRRAIYEGFLKNVIVLTRNKGYRKSLKKSVLPKYFYKDYPNIRKALLDKNFYYNQTLDLIDGLEKEKRAIVIRPERPIVVDRMEKNINKLTALYDEGYECAEKAFKEMLVYK